MNSRSTFCLLALLLWFALPAWHALAASAKTSCPEFSGEISQTKRGDKTVIRCRCYGERLHYQGQCVTPEEAPLTARAFAVMTGKAFSAGAALQDYARKQNWAPHAIRYWDFSTLEAKLGRYHRARAFLEMARDLVKTDQVLVTLDKSLAQLQEYRKKELAKYFRNYPDPVVNMDEWPVYELFFDFGGMWLNDSEKCFGECEARARLYDRVILEARLDRESGDYDRAIAKYEDARRISNLARFRAYYRRAANDGIVWSRQLRAAREESRNPAIAAERKSLNRIRRREISAVRAELLASHLSEAGRGKAAIPYLEEARAYYREMKPKRAPYLAKQIARLQGNEKAFELSKTRDGRPLTIYSNVTSQTDIMFDAIEYGAGDWFKSIEYLETALSADPKNRKIFGALNYVKGLGAAK